MALSCRAFRIQLSNRFSNPHPILAASVIAAIEKLKSPGEGVPNRIARIGHSQYVSGGCKIAPDAHTALAMLVASIGEGETLPAPFRRTTCS